MKPFKLTVPNKFGNYDQFTDENGKQEYKNGIVINHMTGEEISKWQGKNLDKMMEHIITSGDYRSPTTKELQTLLDRQ